MQTAEATSVFQLLSSHNFATNGILFFAECAVDCLTDFAIAPGQGETSAAYEREGKGKGWENRFSTCQVWLLHVNFFILRLLNHLCLKAFL